MNSATTLLRPTGNRHPTAKAVPGGLDLEVVVVAPCAHDAAGHDRGFRLCATVHALHRRLAAQDVRSWQLTVVDNAATEETWSLVEELAAELPGVEARHLTTFAGRKQLRTLWAASAATTVAFIVLADVAPLRGHDADDLLAPVLCPIRPVTTLAGSPTASVVPVGRRAVSRRVALGTFGGLGLTAFLVACGSSTKSSGTTATSTTAASTTAATSTTPTSDAVLMPELTEGPYYLDLDLVRSDVREDRAGVPLEVHLSIVDTATGRPVAGAMVDIWHADGNGLYSGFASAHLAVAATASTVSPADDGTFLRGTQISGTDGSVAFTTIYPGWYPGRAVHIHVKVHVDGNEIHTGQLFFDDSFSDTVFASASPYDTRGTRDTLNVHDSIYASGGAASTLTPSTVGSGYSTTLAMGVKVS
jgi:protocatechuate 3,4-dioxygenase beta subunit